MTKVRRVRGSAAFLVVLAGSAVARADDVLSRDVEVRVTETAVVDYRFDNRNGTRADDHYGEWLNRLNVQATSGRFTAAIRFDSAVYVLRPNPNAIAEKDAQASGIGGPERDQLVDQSTLAYGRDLSSRFRNVAYPSKVYVTYVDAGLSLTVGDTYAQLGRGLVLSMRKVDELGVDTTLRGAKADYKGELGPLRVGATVLAGLTNPLRVDEPSGRVLSMAGGGRGDWFPLMPRPHAVAPYLPIASATFSPDLVVGGHLEIGAAAIQLGVNAAQVTRDPSPFATPFLTGSDAVTSRNARSVSVASVSMTAPKILDHGDAYLEVATQRLASPIERRASDPESGVPGVGGTDRELLARLSGGYAIYAFATLYEGPFTLTLEGKHYERFFPIAASVDPSVAEFSQLQYSAPPTTELVTNDTQLAAFNTCVTGGRARLDWRAAPEALVYASLGRYVTYGERDVTAACGQAETTDAANRQIIPGETRAIRNDVWDSFVGFELAADASRTHAYASMGVRFDDTAEPESYAGLAPTTIFYREGWLRYDLLKHLSGPFSLELAGFHRYRYEPGTDTVPWREGELYQSLIVAPKLSFIMGYEYSTKDGPRKDYYNGLVQWRVSSDTALRLFAGQTRPALRCVSGVCRQFPAFEGVKVELVARFLERALRKTRARGRARASTP